jgi:hypothetical protein
LRLSIAQVQGYQAEGSNLTVCWIYPRTGAPIRGRTLKRISLER